MVQKIVDFSHNKFCKKNYCQAASVSISSRSCPGSYIDHSAISVVGTHKEKMHHLLGLKQGKQNGKIPHISPPCPEVGGWGLQLTSALLESISCRHLPRVNRRRCRETSSTQTIAIELSC